MIVIFVIQSLDARPADGKYRSINSLRWAQMRHYLTRAAPVTRIPVPIPHVGIPTHLLPNMSPFVGAHNRHRFFMRICKSLIPNILTKAHWDMAHTIDLLALLARAPFATILPSYWSVQPRGDWFEPKVRFESEIAVMQTPFHYQFAPRICHISILCCGFALVLFT